MTGIVARLGYASIFEELRAGAADRDRDRTKPVDEVRRLADSGIGAVRIPKDEGGGGIALTELFEFVRELAAVDPNIAHALRNHYGFVEQRLRLPVDHPERRWLKVVAAGSLIGGSFSELTSDRAGVSGTSTVLNEHDDGYLLNGDKFYSTGNLYADYIFVNAARSNGESVTVVVPSDRAGVDLTDDWDGIGQRLTGSGSTRYRDVQIDSSEVVPADASPTPGVFHATFPQLYLTTVIAGIVRNTLADAVAIVQARRRNYYHGSATTAREEPSIQQTVGQISANSFAIDAAVAAAAQQLEFAWRSDEALRPQLTLEAALAAAKTKVFVDELAGKTTWLLFEVGGASTARQAANLDRHWRNARTLSSHNPGSFKLRYLGDHALNEALPPTGSFF